MSEERRPSAAEDRRSASRKMEIVCLDLEGVLVPEIWINVSKRTGIAELSRTTRDEPDYDKLMRGRIAILDRHGLKLADIQTVIASMAPLDGALDFLARLRERSQVVILSDTFAEFAKPLMRQLGWPTLFCNSLEIDANGRIAGYRLRQTDGKRKAVEALRSLEFRAIAAGDSYNDTSMLAAANAGILFRPPDNVIRDFPQFPVTHTYEELTRAIDSAAENLTRTP
jgi:phosphoserine/homoserine phosphotransferase